jgi:hypothetical protein
MSELVIRTARETLLTACTSGPITRAEAERLLGLHDAQRSADTAARLLAERDRHTTRDFRDGIEHAARRVAEYGAEGYAAAIQADTVAGGEGE